jgi:predicted metalloprotease with PDZ domain
MKNTCIALLLVLLPGVAWAQPAPITYKVTFPEPEHHWMQVEMTVSGLGTAPLHARMSRSSPGRYAVHEFAKNIFWLEATDSAGKKLAPARPDVDEWLIAGHDGSVRIIYKIFGDRADGTYFGVDTTHAHLNMPAAFLWAAGLENRSMRVTFTPPAGSNWKVGTQLFPTEDSLTFTAPNLQYFMDSPTEVSNFVLSTFSVPNADGTPANFRLVTHTDAGQSDVDELAKLVQRLVREQMMVFGEFPKFEPGYYTFLLDYSAWGDGDGMEHRNSTMISEPGLSLRDPNNRRAALDTISHEFFHTWNVERIRPVGIEPFDFSRENITCCLWLAEGFTQYYGELLQVRAGFSSAPPVGYASGLLNRTARNVRSAVQMSEQAAFADAATAIDRNDRSRTFISYYDYGAAVALGLDLSIRRRTGGVSTLDDYMRQLWQQFGRSAEARAGYVGRPYSLKDLRDVLGALVNDREFADTFFDKYVEGREAADYAALLGQAGYVIRPRFPDAGSVGSFPTQQANGGVLVNGLVPFGTPAYDAGLDLGDVILTIGGEPATTASWNALRQKKPGDSVALTIRRRDGKTVEATLAITADPAMMIDDLATGGTMTADQKAFRAAWLGTKVK